MRHHKPLGELLIDSNLISEEDVVAGIQKQKELGKPLGEILIEEGLISEEQLIQSLGQQLGFPFVNLRQISISDEAMKTITEEIAKRYQVVPIKLDKRTLTIAIADPLNMTVIDNLSLLTGYKIDVVVATKRDIEWSINRYYVPQKEEGQLTSAEEEETSPLDFEEENDGPTISFVVSMISKALVMGASDIHIEPHEKEVIVRYRIDGVLYDIMTVPNHLREAVVSRLKIMANLHITEKRKPQDGGFHMNIIERKLDVRMSTITTLFGEKVVLRLLEKENVYNLGELGFSESNLIKLRKMIQAPHGIILVTGPTGSGKTTTLYAILNELNSKEKNIVTIEDPIEYVLPRINQTQINPKAGVTFSSSLRTILRQDPDIIMVGEIRDEETAKIAVQASLTGHLVISTLHTNTALGSVQRLLNMGIEPYLLASSLKGMMSQRLVRKICPVCKTEIQVEPKVIERNFVLNNQDSVPTFYKGTGCFHCQQSGYRGRLGVHEVIDVDDQLISLINQGALESEMKSALISEGQYHSLADDCLQKVNQGLTTLEEVLRVIYN